MFTISSSSALTVYGVDRLHQSVPRVLIVVGIIAILWYRPRKPKETANDSAALRSFASSPISPF